jgi:nitrogen fixation NifU-like protein
MTVAEAEQVADAFRGILHGGELPADLDLGDLEALQGVQKFPVRVKCAILPWVTMLDAIIAHRQGRAPRPVSTEGTGAGGAPMDVNVKERDR